MTLVLQPPSGGNLIFQSPTTNDPLLDLNTQPSLDLQFAASKTLDDRVSGQNLVTFSRSSTGTYVDSNGVIQTAAIDAPRFDHDPVTGASLGLLVEEARTNLVTYSEDMTNGQWTKAEVTITANHTTAPDGTQTADFIVEDNSTSASFNRIYDDVTVSSGTVYTFSVFVKRAAEGSPRNVRLLLGCGYGEDTSVFNLENGTVYQNDAGGTGQILDYGNGWYRCILVGGLSAATGACTQIRLMDTSFSETYAGDGVSGLYVWGAQFELGSFPTSYIPTSGSAVTRAADVAEITGTNFSSWYNQSEGTMCSTVTAYSGSQWRSNLVMDTALGASTRLQVLHQDATDRLFYGASFATLTPNVSTGQVFKSVWANDGSALYAASNGSNVVTLSGAVTQTMNGLGIGSLLGVAGTFGNGHISRLTYYPYRLPDAKLQTITS